MLLVTGITGHSGQYFLRELINNNYEGSIRCIVRENSDTLLIDSSGLNIEKVIGDLSDQEFVDNALVGIDTLVHISSIFYSINLIKAANRNKVRRTILVHTSGIYSRYKSASEEYKCIEQTIDRIIKNSKSQMGVIYLRPTMIYGSIKDRNMIIFIKMVDKLRLFPVIDQGKNLLQPVNARDLGKAYFQILKQDNIMNGDYVLSGEKPITMIDMFKTISEVLDKKTIFLNVPLGLGAFMAKCLRVLTLGKIDLIEKVQRMGENRSFSHEAASKDFGYNPMDFNEGLRIEIKDYLQSIK